MLIDKDRVNFLKEELLYKINPIYEKVIELGLGGRAKKKNSKKKMRPVIKYTEDEEDPCEKPLELGFKKNMKGLRKYIQDNAETLIYTKKGGISTSMESLSQYIPKEGADENFYTILNTFTELSIYEKILTAFIPPLEWAVEEDCIIRTNYNPIVSTGRTSSFGSALYPSVNIQQMPRKLKDVTYDIRNCYKVRDGYKLVSIDYSGLELCATAHQLNEVFGASRMKDLLNEGDFPTDLHSKFAAQVMSMEKNTHITYEEFLKNKKIGDYAMYRQICKALNLGFPGGIGYEVMGSQLFKSGVNIPKITLKGADGRTMTACSEKQALYYASILRAKSDNIRIKRIGKFQWVFILDELVGLKKRYYEMYPEIEIFLKEKHNDFLTGEVKMKKNEFGEWEKDPLYKFDICGMQRNYATYTKFCNGFLMQTPSAKGAKEMLWDIGQLTQENPDIILDAFIHDEIVIEVADNEHFEKNVDSVAKIMIQSMQKVLNSVRIAVEASGMVHWSKDGDGSFDRLYWVDPKSNVLRKK
jgi:hypothetical protein